VPEPLNGLGIPAVRGRRDDEITFEGVVFPGFTGTLNSVQRLRDAGDAGAPLLLVDGEGIVYGDWVVSRLSERKGPFTPTGIERRAEWSLTLVAVPETEAL
jgi:phage protein U